MNKFKKVSMSLLVGVFLFTSIFGSLSFAKPVYGFPVEDLGAAADRLADRVKKKADEITKNLKEKISTAIQQAVITAVSNFVQKISYELATFAASGGKGQGPFSSTDKFGKFLEDSANSAGGEFIDQLGKPFGLNLCKPPNLGIDLTIRLGLKSKYGLPAEPKCTLTDFADNWGKMASSQYYEDQAQNFNVAFKPSQSDMGFALEADVKIDQLAGKEVLGKEKQREEGQGVSPMTNMIAGDIKSPAQLNLKEIQNMAPSEKSKEQASRMDAMFSTGDGNIMQFGSAVFLNTFLSQVLKNLMKGQLFGYDFLADGGSSSALDIGYSGAGLTNVGKKEAREYFRYLIAPITETIDKYNSTLMANFQICNDNDPSINRGQENCVADQSWSQLVELANSDSPLTIGQAVAETYLDGTKKLYSPTSNASKSSDCYKKGYCYYNLKKMRQARVVPLGFELAALLSSDNEPVSLNEVLANFDESGSPFYHLLDPNWVIKLPDSKCNNYGYTSLLYGDNLGIRMQECVDLQSCVDVDSNGDCSSYGYCTREKNIWSFDFDRCETQNDSCQTYTNTTNKNTFSYLYKTLDSEYCDSENIGCRGYDVDRSRNGDWANGNGNTVYLNKNVEECSSSDDGCSAFKVVFGGEFLSVDEDTDDPMYLYLKKAPNYLGCYDANPSTLDGDWPETKSDLVRINYNEECENYAGVCIPEEEGCNMFNPLTYLGEDIPAKFNPAIIDEYNQVIWNDQCDASCVGYNSYREMPNNYSGGQDLAYIIPSTAETCSVAEEGCSSFTNLSTTAGQVENIEYYSYLRPCILPDPDKQKKYITYENSPTGYQLKVYLLEQDLDSETGKLGAPKYFYKTPAELQIYQDTCSEINYWDGTSAEDCRQFNDDDGNVYYRLLSKTIAVSEECTGYRKNVPELYVEIDITSSSACVEKDGYWDGDSCQLCYQNGEYRNGYCFYEGLPDGINNNAGTSLACSAEVESCSAYKGNAGNNVKELTFDDFESSSTTVALSGWTGQNISLSNEATQMNGHSLYYRATSGNKTLTKNIVEEKFESDGNYSLTFWAKGIGEADIYLVGITAQEDNQIGDVFLTDNWKEYKFNLNKFIGDNLDEAVVKFKFSDAGDVIYLDNVSLVEVNEYLYLVKNTLSVPGVCDSNLNDNLPGEALGCATYLDINSKTYYLNNFSYLCREEAVGCTALVDTHNTIESALDSSGNTKGEEVERYYNVALKRITATTDELENRSIKITDDEYKCTIQKGENECFVNIFGHSSSTIVIADGSLDNAYYIPKDNTVSTPIYLVVNEGAYCSSQNKGCMETGLKGVGLNDSSVFENVFIKNDPDSYESKNLLCNYLGSGCDEYTSSDGNFYFKDPALMQAGICEYKTNVTTQYGSRTGWFRQDVGVCSSAPATMCTDDSGCAVEDDVCVKKGSIPCYSDYVLKDGSYGILPSGSAGYTNLVGECPASESGCTKYLDHNDADSYDNPEEYYFLEQSVEVGDECEGKASISYGCILLDKTDNPTKMYDTASTYVDSGENEYNLVKPTDSGFDNNDANIIVNAVKDRECAEWLYCNVARMDEDDNTGEPIRRCYSLGSCNESNNSILGCANDNTYEVLSSEDLDDDEFSIDEYKGRDISWNGFDYSGYTIFDVDPKQKNYQSIGSKQILTEFVNNYSQQSTENLKGLQTCRSYPEETSPYLRDVLKGDPYLGRILEYHAGFINSNLFSNASTTIDDCSYIKGTYGDGGGVEAYWSLDLDGEEDNTRVCNYGDKKGMSCQINKDCNCPEGSDNDFCACVPMSKKEIYRGVEGICMEKDGRFEINNTDKNACMTWLPVDQPKGLGDIYLEGSNVTSEYVLPNDNKDRFICLYNEAPLKLEVFELADTGMIEYENTYDIHGGQDGINAEDINDYKIGESGTGRHVFPEDFSTDQRFDLEADTDDKFKISKVDDKAADYVAAVYFWDNGRIKTGDDTDSTNDARVIYALDSDDQEDHVVNFLPLMVPKKDVVKNDEGIGESEEFRLEEPEEFLSLNGSALNKNDIERIDVYLDKAGNMPNITPGLVVFDKGRLELSDKIYEEDDASGYISQFMNEITVIAGKEFDSWTWMGAQKGTTDGKDMPKETELFGTDLNNFYGIENGIISKECINLNDGLDPDNSDCYKDEKYSDVLGNFEALGIRILFDEDGNLHGFHTAMMEDFSTINSNASVGMFFIVYTTNGSCKTVAKVWDKIEGGKPYAKNLIEEDHNLFSSVYDYAKNNIMPFRGKNEIYLDYGLIESSFTVNSGKIWVDPYTYKSDNLDKTNWWYDSRYNKPRLDFGYFGGIPLMNFRYGDLTEPVLDWNCNDDNVAGSRFGLQTKSASCDFLHEMFAKIYGVWKWDDANKKWKEKKVLIRLPSSPSPAPGLSVGNQLSFDVSSPLYGTDIYSKKPPTITAVSGDCPSGDKNCAGEEGTFSINGQYKKDVVLNSAEEVLFQFYMSAEPNQMPIKRVMFNTNITNSASTDLINMEGSFPNYKEKCGDGGFGDEEGEGCISEPIEIYTRYPCDVTDLMDFASGIVSTTAWESLDNDKKYNETDVGAGYARVGQQSINLGLVADKGLVVGDIVCVYKPRVQVMDNWDWCTGGCEDEPVLSVGGCYNGDGYVNCDGAISDLSSHSWTKFEGRLIIVPNIGVQGASSDYDPVLDF